MKCTLEEFSKMSKEQQLKVMGEALAEAEREGPPTEEEEEMWDLEDGYLDAD